MKTEQHPTEEQLILYHYGEAGERAAVEAHLAACDACRAGYQALERVLAAVAAAPLPERADSYGSQVWERLRPRLAERPASRWAGFLSAVGSLAVQPRRWAAVAAMAGLLLAAFLAGRFWPRPGPDTQSQAARVIPSQVRDRILLVTVGDHLERSQMVLIELVNAGGGAQGERTVDISAEQQRAQDLVGANRLYRQTAAGAGRIGIATVLEELERVLLEIEHSPSQLSAQELERMRQRIEAQGILFKVRVVGSRVREQASAPTQEQVRARF